MDNNNNNNHHNRSDFDEEEDSRPLAEAAAAATTGDLSLEQANRHYNNDDDDDDDDEDNWSRQVETDETIAAGIFMGDESSLRMESVAEEEQDDNVVPLGPIQPRLTMKEKLVLRERQRRIETERARLKRQFALNNDPDSNDEQRRGEFSNRNGANGSHDDHDHANNRDNINNHGAAAHADAAGGGGGASTGLQYELSESAVRENGSAAGTLGEESTKAHPDMETAPAQEQLGFNMERFLRNSDTFKHPAELAKDEQKQPTIATAGGGVAATTTTTDQGPVMERFLSDPVVVGSSEPEPDTKQEQAAARSADVQRSVSFDVLENATGENHNHYGGHDHHVHLDNQASISMDANSSVIVQADEDDAARDPLSTPMASMEVQDSIADSEDLSMTPSEQPRVLRLTEADMQEMAAIEEASIGNGPPSERTEEDLSEIGELADFGGHHATDAAGNFSQGTPTTAMESVSMHSGNRSAPPASATSHDHGTDQLSLDGIPSASMSSQLLGSPGASANPDAHIQDLNVSGRVTASLNENQRLPTLDDTDHDMQDQTDSDGGNSEGLVNRRMRPGMVNLRPQVSRNGPRNAPAASTSRSPIPPMVVEGFDFDKHEPMSPRTDDDQGGSLRDLPDVGWSPAGNIMHISPIQTRAPPVQLPATEEEPAGASRNYGSMEDGPSLPYAPLPVSAVNVNETEPLLGMDVPPEIITSRHYCGGSHARSNSGQYPAHSSVVSIASIMEHAFLDVVEEEEQQKVRNEAAHYEKSSILQKAFPERMFALCVTLVLEIPVLFMISGGSDALCGLIGRKRYQLMVGFIPLTSAISGNVGLQASTLTTRAVSHSHVTPQSYSKWFWAEVGAAAWLGLGMGIMQGSIAFFASGMDIPFTCTLMIAQFISMLTAGMTGTFAPLLFSFVFNQDSGKWGGPLETAIQDIVGSFTMIVLSYHLLSWFGGRDIDPSDTCGTSN